MKQNPKTQNKINKLKNQNKINKINKNKRKEEENKQLFSLIIIVNSFSINMYMLIVKNTITPLFIVVCGENNDII